ncbi:MAG: hypothetical protein N3E42_00535 [Candidatus Bipolaricaulota bacterium]|nr:hypothetical protein [Candidatus Bipolaricaulota bacterium]
MQREEAKDKLVLSDAQGFIIRSALEENFIGIWGFDASMVSLDHSTVRGNQHAGVILNALFEPRLMGRIFFIEHTQYAVVVHDSAAPLTTPGRRGSEVK